MRYFFIKPKAEKDDVDFKSLFETLLDAPVELNPTQFRRLGKLYNKFSDLKAGDYIEIEDQDHETLKLKLNAYVSWLSKNASNSLKNEIVQDFVQVIEEMPIEDPRKKEAA